MFDSRKLSAILAGMEDANNQLRQIRKILAPMPNDLATLESELKDLKQTVSDTAARVSAKLAALDPNSPDYSADILDVQADIDALKAIAPAPPVPVPVANPVEDVAANTPPPEASTSTATGN